MTEDVMDRKRVLDEMVRDFTQVGSRPKSEVRRRIAEYAASRLPKAEAPEAKIEVCWCGIEREDHREHYQHPFEPAAPPVAEPAPQTFEEWWAFSGCYWNITNEGDSYEKAIARGAWNAAKASSPETGEPLPNGKPNTPENALLLRWNKAASQAGMAGSEYVDDPERVFARVRENREAMMRALVAAKASSPAMKKDWSQLGLKALNYLNDCLLDDVPLSIEKLREILDVPASSPEVAGGESEWVSVNERLPKKETPVLILRNGVIRVGERRWEEPTHEDTYQAFWYWDDPSDDGQPWENHEITHWRPLPALPDTTQPLIKDVRGKE